MEIHAIIFNDTFGPQNNLLKILATNFELLIALLTNIRDEFQIIPIFITNGWRLIAHQYTVNFWRLINPHSTDWAD